MRTSRVECLNCGMVSDAIGWGFTLMAHEGWTLDEVAGETPSWRCAECTECVGIEESSSGSHSTAISGMTLRHLRVLLVDDEEIVLRATARFLSGFDVRRAKSGEEALALLEAAPNYDAIVSDVSMPSMTGANLFCSVSERWPELTRRFILVSGNVFKARPLIALASQRVGVPAPVLLEKPLDPELLQAEVLAAIAGRAPRSGAYSIDSRPEARRQRFG